MGALAPRALLSFASVYRQILFPAVLLAPLRHLQPSLKTSFSCTLLRTPAEPTVTCISTSDLAHASSTWCLSHAAV